MNRVPLAGTHVSLVPFDEKYKQFIFDCYNDYNSRKLYTNDNSILSYSNFYVALKNKINTYYHIYFIIINNKTDLPVGFVYSHNYNIKDGHLNTTIFIVEKMRTTGVALEAGILFFNYLFENFPIRNIYCTVYKYNDVSFNFLTKIGFRVEGELKEHKYFDGKYHSMYILTLPKDNFNIILNKFKNYINK